MRPFGWVPLGTIDFLYFNFTENEQNNLFMSTLVQTWENHACLQGHHNSMFGGANGPEFNPSAPKMIAFLKIYFSFRDNWTDFKKNKQQNIARQKLSTTQCREYIPALKWFGSFDSRPIIQWLWLNNHLPPDANTLSSRTDNSPHLSWIVFEWNRLLCACATTKWVPTNWSSRGKVYFSMFFCCGFFFA